MSRILVLFPVALWFIWTDAMALRAGDAGFSFAGIAMFLVGIATVVLSSAWAGKRAANLEARGRRSAALPRVIKRLSVPLLLAWFTFGIFGLGWGSAVMMAGNNLSWHRLVLPETLIATFPIYAAWAVLLLTDYPIVRQRRENRLLVDLNEGRPVYALPTALRFWLFAMRQRLLFALVPLVLVLALRDLLTLGLSAAGIAPSMGVQTALLFGSLLFVIAISPELMRRLLPTQPLPDGPLRDRLEQLCQRTGLKVRNILLWDTDGTMVNAAVVGMVPQLRYVLLSDLMVDSMTPRQVEAVFAHEIGHIRHRHLAWYLVFLAGITLVLGGPIDAAWQVFSQSELGRQASSILAQAPELGLNITVSLGVLGVILLLFGLLSRCFERQADVYAARMMQVSPAPVGMSQGVTLSGPTARTGEAPAVGPEGASLFASSLRHAAYFNHLPLDPPQRRGWPSLVPALLDQFTHFLHGTIRSRIDYITELARHPERTRLFDLRVSLVKIFVLAMAAFGVAYQVM